MLARNRTRHNNNRPHGLNINIKMRKQNPSGSGSARGSRRGQVYKGRRREENKEYGTFNSQPRSSHKLDSNGSANNQPLLENTNANGQLPPYSEC